MKLCCFNGCGGGVCKLNPFKTSITSLVPVGEESLSCTPFCLSNWVVCEILSLCEFDGFEWCVELFVDFFFSFFAFRPLFPFGIGSTTGSVGRFDILYGGRSLGSVMSHDDLRRSVIYL